MAPPGADAPRRSQRRIFERVYAAAPYDARNGRRDTLNATDGPLRRSGLRSIAAVAEQPDRYVAALTLAVARGGG